MSTNWDLYLIDPLFVLAGLLLVFLTRKKERGNWHWVIFYVEVITIWIANGFVMKVGLAQIGVVDNLTNTGLILFGIFGASTLFALILKPVASLITRQFQSRRTWLWSGIATTSTALILVSVFAGTSNTGLMIFILVIAGFMIGFSLASQSIYFLFFNEQFYYRMFPLVTSAKVGVLCTLGTFTGIWMFGLTYTAQGANRWTSDINPMIPAIICGVFVIVSLVLSFYNKEDKQFNAAFDADLNSKFIKCTPKTIILLFLSVLFCGTVYGVTQNEVVNIYLAASLMKMNFSEDQIYQVIRIFRDWYLAPQFLVGYAIYKYLWKKIGLKQMMVSLIVLTIVLTAIMAFFHNPFAYIIFNFILGICLTQLFYILYAMAIMWNYRANGYPVTGSVTSLILVGPFLTDSATLIFKWTGVGVFKYATNVDQVIHGDYNAILNSSNSALTVLFAAAFALAVGYLIWILVFGNTVIGEYANIDEMLVKMKHIERANIVKKIQRKMEI